jgi:uncharacterized UBP type Zn finger protein
MNSVIQSLFTLNILNEFLVRNKNANTTNIVNTYVNLIQLINGWQNDNYIDEETLANYFVIFSDAVNAHSQLFSSGMAVAESRQQDASEFLLVLFDEMEKNLTPRQTEMFKNIIGLTHISGSNMYHSNMMDVSLIANPDLFENKNLTQIYADNLQQKILYDSVQEAFNAAASTFLPVGTYITLKLNIFSFINNSAVKIKYPLQIQENLKTVNGDYILVAMTCHQGDSVGGGHYAAYVKRAEGWYFCNDSIIDFLGQFNTIDTHRRLPSTIDTRFGRKNRRDFDPYILFYAKKESQNSNIPSQLPQPIPADISHYTMAVEEFSQDLQIVELLLR